MVSYRTSMQIVGDLLTATEQSGQETEGILQEAAAVAETQIGEKFPSVPTNYDSVKTSTDSLTGL